MSPTGVRTVHLVYPHGDQISAPDSIGRHVGRSLADKYHVRRYDWMSREVIVPGVGDILLGHPHPDPATIFRRSAQSSRWHRVLMMCPFNGDLRQIAFLDTVIRRVDRYLAITGPYWYRWAAESSVSHWLPRMVHIDMAVDRSEFPRLERRWNPSGRRKFLYVGHSGWMKNTKYLSAIAERMSGTEFSWIGVGRPIEHLRSYGRQDFSEAKARSLVAQHDFMVSVSTADANPTTLLEAMAWGLVPVCTPQSGYSGIETIVNLPVDDLERAVSILQRLNAAPEAELDEIRARNWLLLDKHYNWNRFAQQVEEALESTYRAPLGHETLWHRVRLAMAAATSPYSPVHPRRWRWIASQPSR